jgi:hypothetical protein
MHTQTVCAGEDHLAAVGVSCQGQADVGRYVREHVGVV